MTNIFTRIRDQSEFVALNSSFVQIDHGNLVKYPDLLQLNAMPELSHDPNTHFLDQGENTLIFFLILDTVNFGSGYFPHLKKEVGFSGYFTIASKLTEFFRKYGTPHPYFLQNITPEECGIMFGQNSAHPKMKELLGLFSKALNDLGSFVLDNCKGDYLHFLRKKTTAATVIEKLSQMPFFKDEQIWKGELIPFYKRAQIFLQDIVIAEPDNLLTKFKDINRLTAFSDNLLPYVFRADGLMRLKPELEEKINNGEPISKGSTEEVEIRACTIYVVEELNKLANDVIGVFSPRQLDFYLWNRGQKLKKTSPLLRHRCETVFY